MCHSNVSGIQYVSICADVGQFNNYVILHQLFWVPHSKDLIGTCSDMLYTTVRKLWHFSYCSECPTRGLIGEADTARSSQGHLVSSNWPVWADQPTVHHSVWEDHFHSHHTHQHTFLLTIRYHRPGRWAGVLCKGSCSYTEWKWYL